MEVVLLDIRMCFKVLKYLSEFQDCGTILSKCRRRLLYSVKAQRLRGCTSYTRATSKPAGGFASLPLYSIMLIGETDEWSMGGVEQNMAQRS